MPDRKGGTSRSRKTTSIRWYRTPSMWGVRLATYFQTRLLQELPRPAPRAYLGQQAVRHWPQVALDAPLGHRTAAKPTRTWVFPSTTLRQVQTASTAL